MLKLHQVFLVGSGLAAFVASGALLYLHDTRGAVAAAIVATSVLVFWRARDGKPRLGRRHWLGLGLLGGGFVILGFPVGLVAGSFVVLFVLQLLLNAVVARNVGRITLERLDDPAVMPGAEEFVQQFSTEGFRIVGSYRFQTIETRRADSHAGALQRSACVGHRQGAPGLQSIWETLACDQQ